MEQLCLCPYFNYPTMHESITELCTLYKNGINLLELMRLKYGVHSVMFNVTCTVLINMFLLNH